MFKQSDLVVDALAGCGVRSIFCVPEEEMLDLLDMVGLSETPERPINFLCMAAWISDCPDLSGGVVLQWTGDLYQDNLLVRNFWSLDGRAIALANITMPLLNIGATRNHIVPAEISRALRKKSYLRSMKG